MMQLINKTKNNIMFYDYLVFAFFVSFICTRIVSMPDLLANFFPALIGLLCFVYVFVRKDCNVKEYAIVISLFLSILEIIGIAINSNNSFYDIIWIWSYMGVALIIGSYNLNAKLLLILFYGVAIFFVYCMMQGIAADDVLSIGSENNISVYLLLLVCLYFYSIRKKNQLPYIPILLTLVITLWSASRGGLISVGLLLVGASLYNYTQIKGRKNLIIFLIILALFSCFFGIDSFNSLLEPMETKFRNYGAESLRFLIWNDYFNSALNDPIQFVFGVKIFNFSNVWLSHYGNPHNSFLTLHANFGMLGVFFVFFGFMKKIIDILVQRDFVFFVILAALISRSFFDWTAFSGPYDAFYFAILLMSFSKPELQDAGLYGNKLNVI